MAMTRPDYLQTKAELTQAGKAASAPSLCDAWGAVTTGERDNAVLLGLGGSVESSNKDQLYASRNDEITKQEKERAQVRNSDILFLALLDSINDRIADLDKEMASLSEELKAKYGEDYIEGMASTFLSEKEREGLKTDEERLKALADKFLDDDGKIKPEYADRPEAKYVRSWAEKENLQGLKNTLNNGDPVTDPHQKILLEEMADNDLAASFMNETKDIKTGDVEVQRAATVESDHSLDWGGLG